MQSLQRQRGLSFWSMMILVPMVGFYLYLGIKIGPEYLNFLQVKNAVESVANEQELSRPNKRDMRISIDKRLDVSSIYFMEKEYINFKEMDDGLHILTKYDREIPIIGNIFLLMKFEHDAKVKDNNQNQ